MESKTWAAESPNQVAKAQLDICCAVCLGLDYRLPRENYTKLRCFKTNALPAFIILNRNVFTLKMNQIYRNMRNYYTNIFFFCNITMHGHDFPPVAKVSCLKSKKVI